MIVVIGNSPDLQFPEQLRQNRREKLSNRKIVVKNTFATNDKSNALSKDDENHKNSSKKNKREKNKGKSALK